MSSAFCKIAGYLLPSRNLVKIWPRTVIYCRASDCYFKAHFQESKAILNFFRKEFVPMFRVGLQYLDCRITTFLNQTPSWYFPENFRNFWNQIFL